MTLTPPPFDLRAAWGWAYASLRRIASVFGDPVAIRDQGVMRRGDIQAVLAWLRPLEALVRRLLLIEAARQAPSPRRNASAPWDAARAAALRGGARRRSFRVLPNIARSGNAHARTFRGHPDALIASGPLALRFDALVGALAARRPLITRLARRLYDRDPRVMALGRLKRSDMRSEDADGFAAASAAEFALAEFLASMADFLSVFAVPAPDSS